MKKLGIIGGMGSFATLYLFKRVVEFAPSNNDRDYVEVFLHNNSKVPDRTEAILKGGPSSLPELLRSAKYLEACGADYIIIACITAHYYQDLIQQELKHSKIISVLDQTLEHIRQLNSKPSVVGILASTGAIRANLWQSRLEQLGIESVLLPDNLQEELIMSAIYDEKGLKQGVVSSHAKEKFIKATSLLINAGAQSILAGCSEVPMVLSQEDVAVHMIDSIDIVINRTFKNYLLQ